MLNVNWNEIKTFVNDRSLSMQYILAGGKYYIRAYDSNFQLGCEIIKTTTPSIGSDQEDFETNYLPSCNENLSDLDSAGRSITRIAASNKGTSYKAHFFDFTTCKIDSLTCKGFDGMMDLGFTTKYYKMDGTELTTQVDIDTMCVKTVVNFSPMYDYELVSGTVNLITSPTENLRLWVTGGVSELGGVYVKEFIRNLNLRYISSSETLQTDGRASKYMKATTMGVPYNTNQLQIIVTSETPGIQQDIMMAFEYFMT